MSAKFMARLALVQMLIFVCMASNIFAASGGDESHFQVEDKPYEDLNKMELLANEARDLYWKGQYQKALDIFYSLATTNHPSTPLYFNELAQCQIALGNLSDAEKSLRSVDNFFLAYNTGDREQKALSSFGKEADKIYLGDPYERSTNYLLLALIYSSRGDYENALAACKSGILADADARENKGDSDYTMLQLLEMKILQILGKSDNAMQARDAARTSYINTHPLVRDLLSERLDKFELLVLPQEQRDKLNIKETPTELQAKLSSIEESLAGVLKNVNPEKDLNVLLTGDYNTLVIVPKGKGPHKGRKGKDGELVVIESDPTSYQRPTVLIDGATISVNPVSEVADINFHAVTRGGRKMDALLRGKAVYRSTTVGAGALISEMGNRMGGMAGLAMVFVGIAAQGIGGAMSPEADTRCWQLLPSSFDVYALNLPAGEHEIKIQHHIYFETHSQMTRNISINGQKGMVVMLAPPAPVGRYSDMGAPGVEIKKIARSTAPETGPALILTPPLGLKKIDRFPPIDTDEKPEAIAPDWKKIIRKLDKRLSNSSFQLEKVSHQDITSNYESLRNSVPWALQTDFGSLDLKKDKDDKVYSLQINFSLVETATGKTATKETIVGVYRKTDNDKTGSTDAYYKCFEDALEKFLADKNLSDLIKAKIQSANLL